MITLRGHHAKPAGIGDSLLCSTCSPGSTLLLIPSRLAVVTQVREHQRRDVRHRRALEELDLLVVHRHARAPGRTCAVRGAVAEPEHAAALNHRIVEEHAQVVHRDARRRLGKLDSAADPSSGLDELLACKRVDHLGQRRLGDPGSLRDLRNLKPAFSGPGDKPQTDRGNSYLSGEHRRFLMGAAATAGTWLVRVRRGHRIKALSVASSASLRFRNSHARRGRSSFSIPGVNFRGVSTVYIPRCSTLDV